MFGLDLLTFILILSFFFRQIRKSKYIKKCECASPYIPDLSTVRWLFIKYHANTARYINQEKINTQLISNMFDTVLTSRYIFIHIFRKYLPICPKIF